MKGIEGSRDTGVRTHVCRVSTKKGIELLVDAKSAELPITFEVCPHYLLCNEHDLRIQGGFAKMNPTLRSAEEMAAVEEYVCRCYADVVATDHAPHRWKKKCRKITINVPVDIINSELNRIWDYVWRWYPWVKELETANTVA